MTFGSLLRLTRLSMAREKVATGVAVAGIAAGVATLLFFVGLGLGLHRLVQDRIFPGQANWVEVVPPTVSLLGGLRLDEAQVAQMAAWTGVKAAYRKMSVRTPASSRFSGDFFGASIRMGVELSVVGVEAGLLAPDVPATRFTARSEGEPIPAVAAARLVELYNRAYAPARKLPHLTPTMLIGFSLPVVFNHSIPTQSNTSIALPRVVELVGFSDRAPLVSLTIPLDEARRINQAAGVDAETYSSVVLETKSTSDVPSLAQRARELGFDIDDGEQRLAESVGTATLLTTTVLALLGLLVCALAAANIAVTRGMAVQARERELAIMRAVGASRREVQLYVWTHTLLVGLVGVLLGAVWAWGGSLGVQALAVHALPGALTGTTLFYWPAWVWVGAMLLGIFGASCGGFVPSRRVARLDPIETLAARG